MYLNYYNLAKEPFQITPDPEFIYLSSSHREALGSIIYGVQNRKGFISVIGEVGTGKTTVIRAFLANIDRKQVKPIYLFNSHVSFNGLLDAIFNELGLEKKSTRRHEMIRDLHQALVEYFRNNINIVLIIDEAQNMPVKTLENLRMLSNLETNKEKLIQIILVGQPELKTILNKPELRQLKQRMVFRAQIEKLSQADSREYIFFRLGRAGGKPDLFEKCAVNKIVKQAGGIPRLLNIICDNSLIAGFGYQKIKITKKIVNEVIKDLDLESTTETTYKFRWLAPALGLLILSLILFHDNGRLEALYTKNQAPQPAASIQVQNKILKKVSVTKPDNAKNIDASQSKISSPARKDITELKTVEQPNIVNVDSETEDSYLNDILKNWYPDVRIPRYDPDSFIEAESINSAGSNQTTLQILHTTESGYEAGLFNHGYMITVANKHSGFPVRHFVKKGDNLKQLCYKIYGQDDIQIIKMVKKSNPHIRNINHICIGDMIIFPKLQQRSDS